ncbi:MAG: hypothetical protein QOH13_1548 [Thermoleophilaceae bacterium]|nr:hypothetical protein [Thermoleophilaceae bacterium]
MSIDRAGARKRVKTVTVAVAAGAAALTAGAAFGSARDGSVTTKPAAPATRARSVALAGPIAPEQSVPQAPDGSGFMPPSASSGLPQAMSGGS